MYGLGWRDFFNLPKFVKLRNFQPNPSRVETNSTQTTLVRLVWWVVLSCFMLCIKLDFNYLIIFLINYYNSHVFIWHRLFGFLLIAFC